MLDGEAEAIMDECMKKIVVPSGSRTRRGPRCIEIIEHMLKQLTSTIKKFAHTLYSAL